MPTLLFWPLVPFVALCCLVVYWVAVAAFLYSAGDIKPAQLTASSSGALSLAVSFSFLSECASEIFVHEIALDLPAPCKDCAIKTFLHVSCACRCFTTHQQTPQHLCPSPLWQHSLPTSQQPSAPSGQTATLLHLLADHCSTCSSTTSSACFGPTSSLLALGKPAAAAMLDLSSHSASCPSLGDLYISYASQQDGQLKGGLFLP